MNETIWQLFVDESGNFSEDDPDVVVAGILVPIPAGIPSWILRECVEHAAPDVPWPPHAAYVNRGIMHALWAGDPGVAATLEWHCPLTFERVQSHLADRTAPRWEDINELRRHLVLNRRWGIKKWESRAQRVHRAIFKVLEAWAHHETRPVLAMVASEDQARPEEGINARYLGLLTTLIERSAQVISREPGHHVLRVSAQRLGLRSRDALAGVNIKSHWGHMPLRPADVAACCAQAQRDRVRCISFGVVGFGPSAEAEHVFADFVANAARRALTRPLSWEVVARELDRRLPIGIAVTDRALPTVCANGAAAEYVRRAASDELDPNAEYPALEQATLSRPWAAEQAQIWAEELSA